MITPDAFFRGAMGFSGGLGYPIQYMKAIEEIVLSHLSKYEQSYSLIYFGQFGMMKP